MNAYIISITIILSFIIVNLKRDKILNLCCKKNKTIKTNDEIDKVIDTIGPSKIVKELELKKYL